MQCDNENKYNLMLGSVQIHLYEIIQVCIKIIFYLASHYPVGADCSGLSIPDEFLAFIIWFQTHVLKKQYLPLAIKKKIWFVTA